jgi:exonuclease III
MKANKMRRDQEVLKQRKRKNGLNFPIKRHHLANWIKKEDPTISCLQKIHSIDKNKHWLRVKSWKKIYQASGPQKQAGVAIVISDKVDFKLTLVK